MFIGVKQQSAFLGLDLDRYDLLFEFAFGNGLAGPLVTHDTPFICLLAGDLIHIHQILSRHPGVVVIERIDKSIIHHAVFQLCPAHPISKACLQ